VTARPRYLMRALLHAYHWCNESLQGRLQQSGFKPLPRAQSMIMVNVSDGITRPADLARNLGISRQAIQQTLADMEAAGLVRLSADNGDRRAKIVSISAHGRGIGRAAIAAIRDLERDIGRRIGRVRLQQLKTALYLDWGSSKPHSSAAMSARMRRPPQRTVQSRRSRA